MQQNGIDGLAVELAIVAKVCKAEAAPLSTGDKCAIMVQARGFVCAVEKCGNEW
jgi:hypothetical protein